MSGLLAAISSDSFGSREFVESGNKRNDLSVMSMLGKKFCVKTTDL